MREVVFPPYPVLAESPSAEPMIFDSCRQVMLIQPLTSILNSFWLAINPMASGFTQLTSGMCDNGTRILVCVSNELNGWPAARPVVGLAAFLSATTLAESMKENLRHFNHEAYMHIMAKRFEEHQIETLKLAFEESKHLTKSKKIELVEATGLDVEQVTSWFSRKRACKRAREAIAQLELDHSRLQEALKLSRENEAILQQELEESKKRAAKLQDENQCLKQRQTVTEKNEKFGNLDEVCEWELRDKLFLETEIVEKDSIIEQEWGGGEF